MTARTVPARNRHTIAARGVSLTLDLDVGHICHFEVSRGGRTIAPLHVAPWVTDGAVASDDRIAPNVRRLSGDFFCAPFGLNDIEPAPTHGWPANSGWTLLDEIPHPEGGVTARFELLRTVMGARVRKELMLRDGHPFVYQRHRFLGGQGGMTAAHHVMTHLPRGGRSSFSRKAYAELPPIALEPDPARGRSILRYPSKTFDLEALPLAAGGTASLRDYPFAERHEDFFMLVEASESRLGWTAVVRLDAGEAVIVLKDPKALPVTLVWMSNGGRDYPPWSGRHTHVLGIEDARCWSLFGHAASVSANPLNEAGIPTCFELEPSGSVSVRHVLGGVPIPPDWHSIDAIDASLGLLILREQGGQSLTLPYDDAFVFAGET